MNNQVITNGHDDEIYNLFNLLKQGKTPNNLSQIAEKYGTDISLGQETPMHIGAKNKNIDQIRSLIKAGFPIDVMDLHNKYPFHYFPNNLLFSDCLYVDRSMFIICLKKDILLENYEDDIDDEMIDVCNNEGYLLYLLDLYDKQPRGIPMSTLKILLSKYFISLKCLEYFPWNAMIEKKSVWNYTDNDKILLGTKWEIGKYFK